MNHLCMPVVVQCCATALPKLHGMLWLYGQERYEKAGAKVDRYESSARKLKNGGLVVRSCLRQMSAAVGCASGACLWRTNALAVCPACLAYRQAGGRQGFRLFRLGGVIVRHARSLILKLP